MGFSAEVAMVNDRVRRLAERMEGWDNTKESPLHPAVQEDEGSAAAAAAAMGQLAYSRAGRAVGERERETLRCARDDRLPWSPNEGAVGRGRGRSFAALRMTGRREG